MFTFGGGFPATSLAGLSAAVAQAIAGIRAQTATKWFKQHDATGAHTAVTATSVTVDGPLTIGRLSFAPTPFTYGADGARGIVVSPDIGSLTVAEVWHFPNVEKAGVIIPDLSSGSAAIYGLSTIGRRAGDVVALLNFQGFNADLGIRLNATGLGDGKFAGSLSTPNVDVTVPRGRWVWLMLMNLPGATGLRWHVSHF